MRPNPREELPPSSWPVTTRVTRAELRAGEAAERARIAQAVAAREARTAKQAAEQAAVDAEATEAALAPQRAAARRDFFLHNGTASEAAFEAYWKRVRPSPEEVRAQQAAAAVQELRARGPLL